MRPHAMIIPSLSLVLALMVMGSFGSPSDFEVNFRFGQEEVQQNMPIPIPYFPTVSGGFAVKNLSIILLQSTPKDGQTRVDADNTVKLLDVQSGICIYSRNSNECYSNVPGALTVQEAMLPIQSGAENTTTASFVATFNPPIEKSLDNFFFCFANKTFAVETCMYYSRMFKIAPSLTLDDQATTDAPVSTPDPKSREAGQKFERGGSGDQLKVKREVQLPEPGIPMSFPESQDTNNFIRLSEEVSQIIVSGTPFSTTFIPFTTITSTATFSATPSSSVTVTPSATVAPTLSEASSRSNNRLSIAAKVGIALGALAFALILLIVALLFLRRKHAKRNQPEQVMLTHSMHTDSFSRNPIVEKDHPTASSSAAATPIDESNIPSLPIRRHSALATYEPVPSAPYSGAAAAIPRRKPTAATMASTVSRGLSTTSGTSSSGARSPRPGEGFEQYHDVPIYGDARHVPKDFAASSARGMQSPFLSEEGMTPEEVAQLEEEERRIDAAIAEAERR